MEGDDFVVDGAAEAPVPVGGRRGQALVTLVLVSSVLACASVGVARAGEAAAATEAVASADSEPGLTTDSESPALATRWSTASEFAGGNYKWSLSRGSLDLGLRFDTLARNRSLAISPLDASGPFVQTLPTVSLDLRRVEIAPGSSWLRQLAGGDAATSVTHRIGIEWKPAESELMFVRDGLGMRLGGDDRLTMRLRKGTLSIYMKRQF